MVQVAIFWRQELKKGYFKGTVQDEPENMSETVVCFATNCSLNCRIEFFKGDCQFAHLISNQTDSVGVKFVKYNI